MRPPAALLSTLICLALAGACAHRGQVSPHDPGEVRRQVEAVLEQQRLAWNRGDLPGYMAGYARSDQLVFTSGGKIRRGWDQTMAGYQKRYGADRKGMGQLAFEVLEVQPAGADAAVMLGRWRLSDTPAAGSGVFSVVFQRLPEGWRIVHDHTSADPAAAPAASP